MEGRGELIVFVRGEDRRAQYFLAKRLVELMPRLKMSELTASLAEGQDLAVRRVETEEEFEAFREQLEDLDRIEARFVRQRKIGEFDVF